MAASHSQSTTIMGTASGTLLSISATIHSGDILKTIILAAIGACVSFVVSIILKRIGRLFKD